MFEKDDLKIIWDFPQDTNTSDESENDTLSVVIPHFVRFGLLLTFEIPSIICYICVIGFILMKKTLRSAPNNYVMLHILFISFMTIVLDIPWELYYYRTHTAAFSSSTFCLIWWFVDLYSFYTCQMLVAWASFERHILIFHSSLLNQKWKKIYFHYMPPLIIIIYMMSFYIYVLFVRSCEDSLTFDNDMCIVPCYLGDPFLGLWESIFHSLLTTICIIIFSCGLLFRFYRWKTRLQQSTNWRDYRKMIFQLISISSLYLSLSLPFFILYIIYMTSYSDHALVALECLSFFGFFIPLFLPFVCLTSIPEIWTKIKRLTHRRRNQQIEPIPLRTLGTNDDVPNMEC